MMFLFQTMIRWEYPLSLNWFQVRLTGFTPCVSCRCYLLPSLTSFSRALQRRGCDFFSEVWPDGKQRTGSVWSHAGCLSGRIILGWRPGWNPSCAVDVGTGVRESQGCRSTFCTLRRYWSCRQIERVGKRWKNMVLNYVRAWFWWISMDIIWYNVPSFAGVWRASSTNPQSVGPSARYFVS